MFLIINESQKLQVFELNHQNCDIISSRQAAYSGKLELSLLTHLLGQICPDWLHQAANHQDTFVASGLNDCLNRDDIPLFSSRLIENHLSSAWTRLHLAHNTSIIVHTGCKKKAPALPETLNEEIIKAYGAIKQNPELAEATWIAICPGEKTSWLYLEKGIIRDYACTASSELYICLSSVFPEKLLQTEQTFDDCSFTQGLRLSQSSNHLVNLLRKLNLLTEIGSIKQEHFNSALLGLVIGLEIASIKEQFSHLQHCKIVCLDTDLHSKYQAALKFLLLDTQPHLTESHVTGLQNALRLLARSNQTSLFILQPDLIQSSIFKPKWSDFLN